MTMSSFLINSNYIEPKFPPFEEYAQHSGPGGGDGGPGGGPGYQQPPAPTTQHLPPQQPQLPHAGGGREPPASYYPARAAREPAYPAATLYPAHGAADAAYPYGYRGGASPGRPPQPEQPPVHAKGPAHGLHASHVLQPGRQPPPPPPPQHCAAPPAPTRRCEAAPATPGVPTGGGAPACPLVLADKSPPGLKGKEPVVYPWMKKIHVSAAILKGILWEKSVEERGIFLQIMRSQAKTQHLDYLLKNKIPTLSMEIDCQAAKSQMADYHPLRAPGHRKRWPLERLELETFPGAGSDLNIFGGKCCAKTLVGMWDTAWGSGEEFSLPSSRQPQWVERASGQYLTSKEFLS
ncbi:homeobox protein Hox-A4 isoform X1 [Dipodomys merriami]|uniref:homeobox protein Hox-A4 isoform X1 n=1 Tax=Dipodomys merriami TaxID=94247 RepID=UPI0038560512